MLTRLASAGVQVRRGSHGPLERSYRAFVVAQRAPRHAEVVPDLARRRAEGNGTLQMGPRVGRPVRVETGRRERKPQARIVGGQCNGLLEHAARRRRPTRRLEQDALLVHQTRVARIAREAITAQPIGRDVVMHAPRKPCGVLPGRCARMPCGHGRRGGLARRRHPFLLLERERELQPCRAELGIAAGDRREALLRGGEVSRGMRHRALLEHGRGVHRCIGERLFEVRAGLGFATRCTLDAGQCRQHVGGRQAHGPRGLDRGLEMHTRLIERTVPDLAFRDAQQRAGMIGHCGEDAAVEGHRLALASGGFVRERLLERRGERNDGHGAQPSRRARMSCVNTSGPCP